VELGLVAVVVVRLLKVLGALGHLVGQPHLFAHLAHLVHLAHLAHLDQPPLVQLLDSSLPPDTDGAAPSEQVLWVLDSLDALDRIA